MKFKRLFGGSKKGKKEEPGEKWWNWDVNSIREKIIDDAYDPRTNINMAPHRWGRLMPREKYNRKFTPDDRVMDYLLTYTEAQEEQGDYGRAVIGLRHAYKELMDPAVYFTPERKKEFARLILSRLNLLKGKGDGELEKIIDSLKGSVERTIPDEGTPSYGIMAIAGLSILASLFFFSFNFTGNAISNIGAHDGNILGAVFFVAGIAGMVLHFRKK